MNVSHPSLQPNFRFISIEGGPQYTVSGKSRHQDVLGKILEVLPKKSYSEHVSETIFGLRVGGEFEDNKCGKRLKTGYHNSLLDRDGILWINLTLASSEFSSSDEEFRDTFSSLIRSATERAMVYLQKKKVDIDQDAYLSDVNQALSLYKLLPFPLPVTSSEISTIEVLRILDLTNRRNR